MTLTETLIEFVVVLWAIIKLFGPVALIVWGLSRIPMVNRWMNRMVGDK